MTRRNVESAMYRPVKAFLEKNYKCTFTCADLPKEQFKVRVPRNLRMREIDVVGVHQEPGKYEIHLAEGKTFAKGHSFAEALNQLQDAADYGHYLWLFFPGDEWRRLPAGERQRNIDKIRKRGFGLILIENGTCREEIGADHHTPEPRNVAQVLACAEIRYRNRIPTVEPIHAAEARRASEALAGC